MLEGFLNRSKAVKRLRIGLFGSFLDSYVDESVKAGYRAATIRMQLWLLDGFQSWLEAKGLAVADLNPAVVDEFVKGRRRWRKRRSMSRAAGGENITLQLLLQRLEARGVISLLPVPKEVSATEQLAERFGTFLKRERGLNPKTIHGYMPYVRRLLDERFRKCELDLSKLTPNDVSRFITRHAPSMSPKRAQLMTSALRSFFRFLLQYGEIDQDLAATVPTVADWCRARVPQFITQTQVTAMLKTCDRSTTCGRRNYALLLILARLGLRASEVMEVPHEQVP